MIPDREVETKETPSGRIHLDFKSLKFLNLRPSIISSNQLDDVGEDELILKGSATSLPHVGGRLAIRAFTRLPQVLSNLALIDTPGAVIVFKFTLPGKCKIRYNPRYVFHIRIAVLFPNRICFLAETGRQRGNPDFVLEILTFKPDVSFIF